MKLKLVALIVGLSFALGGCATVSKDWGILTGSTVSPQAVIVAGNAYDAIEASATNYLTFCKANRTVAGCKGYVSARAAILPAIRAGRVARNNLEAFLIANPGQLGPTGLYNALIAAVNTMQDIASQYQINAVGG